ncbi:MAG: LodA/GoxA family CTQ-dependent oxidase [Actinomycetota bacterium]|nr:LodA/GoxA family CTQ-dependent oxidase [Actinomycetota bacterium]
MPKPPPRYRIHPAIGVARVGNAPRDQFFIGPELPYQYATGLGVATVGTAVPPFKTGGEIKPQAARFRVFEYTESGGKYSVSREITLDEKDVVDLTWQVHLANRKASFFTFKGLAGSPLVPTASPRRNAAVVDRRTLEIDPGPRKISGRSKGPVVFAKGTSTKPAAELWPAPQPSPPIEYLGELRTDGAGRLVAIGGKGVAGGRPGATITDYANNDGWFDDVSDGPVTAKLLLRGPDGQPRAVTASGAWLLVGPPDFAPAVQSPVTLYDVLLDVAARQLPVPADESVYDTDETSQLRALAADLAGGRTALTRFKVDFDRDIAPILRRAIMATWTFGPLATSHGMLGAGPTLTTTWSELSDPAASNGVRQTVLNFLRKPGTPGLMGIDTMPKLLGDDPYNQHKTERWGLTLTVTQMAMLTAWASGKFVGSVMGQGWFTAPLPPLNVTPHGLDRAALESCSGGGFYPGIEVGWQIREPELFAEPFRVKHGAPSKYVGDTGVTVRAGHFSRQMALPWHADFLQCKNEVQKVSKQVYGWWPAQRPDAVYPDAAEAEKRDAGGGRNGSMLPWIRASTPTWPGGPNPMPSYDQMIANWWKFGFVVTTPKGSFAESERPGTIP